MTTLVPTVHERLARCGTRVDVDGLAPGADVILSVGGVESSHTALGAFQSFIVPLTAGVKVKAKQDAGEGFTGWSPEVEVEDAAVPPDSAPGLPESVGACNECVKVDGLVPGSRVKLRLGSQIVGEKRANRKGRVCVPVDLTKLKGRASGSLSARMYVCGEQGPKSTVPFVNEPELPKPKIKVPLYACQSEIALSNLHRGARFKVTVTEAGIPTKVVQGCCCATAINVKLGLELENFMDVRAQLFWKGKPCADEGPITKEDVISETIPLKPTILPSLIDGDQYIRVDNQVPNAMLMIRIKPSKDEAAIEYGPRPASSDLEIALNNPLQAGNVVTVKQSLCGHSEESEKITVLPAPDTVLAPVIIPPLYDCGAAVQVSNVYPGALVRVYMDGFPIGLRWAGEEISISVPLAPFMVAGGSVTARQWVGGVESPPSAPLPVLPVGTLQTPRILRPVARGDIEVWVSRVTPGARISILSAGATIGEIDAAESIVRVPVAALSDTSIRAKARLCQSTAQSVETKPNISPCAAGKFPNFGEKFVEYDDWMVPDTQDGHPFSTSIEGLVYFPATSGGRVHPRAGRVPLVILVHGFWYPETVGLESYKGFDYLASHLARWGCLVFSLSMEDVNTESGGGEFHQYARGEIILHAIDEILADADLGVQIQRDHIGLMGHSVAAEGVVAAQFLNERENRGYGIRGVVSIAPTHWRPELVLRKTKYMQIFGSKDHLLYEKDEEGKDTVTGSDEDAHFSGFRIYDRAWRPKTHFFIHGIRHHPFNRNWVLAGDMGEQTIADDEDTLQPAVHERIAKCLINAFFQDALFDTTPYAGYMHGTIFPRSLHGLKIHTQHSGEIIGVLDNFGDIDEEVATLGAGALNKNKNSKGKTITVTGSGKSVWDDIEHTALDNSPHNTKSVWLSWTQPNVLYRSDTGGLSVGLTDVLSLRIAQFYQDDVLNPLDQPVDLFVVLSDGSHEAIVRLGAVAQIPYPVAGLSVMRTVRIPVDAFKGANPAFNHNHIQSVTLWLAARPTGNILVDDLEFGS